MGYEVQYRYHPEISKGEYNREEVLTADIKVGSPYEDVPLEVLAGRIMALMARRNILVTDVQCYEIVKKPITFKESEDGIVIKNRKFRFDDGPAVDGEVLPEQPEEIIAQVSKMLQQISPGIQPHQLQALLAGRMGAPAASSSQASPRAVATAPNHRPMRYEIFDPEKWVLETNFGQPANLKFTKGKRYPIFEEKLGHQAGVIYITVDDDGNRQQLLDKFFVPSTQLTNEDAAPVKQINTTEKGLRWDGMVRDDIPDIRRR